MRFIGKLLCLAFLGLGGFPAWAAHTQVRLLLAADTARPGDTVLAGVELRMDPGWHTYWRSPGPAGTATTVTWELPAGATAQGLQWPVPEKLPDPEFTTYVYTNEVVLLVPLKLAPDLPPGPLHLKAKASWLECAQSCIPGSAPVEATLNIGSATKPSQDAATLATWQKRLPQTSPALAAHAGWEKPATGDRRPFLLEWNTPAAVTDADFFPDGNEHWEVQGPTEKAPAQAGHYALRKEVKKFSGDWPQRITGVLVEQVGGEQHAYELDVPVGSSSVAAAATSITPAKPITLWRALLYAFLGGLVLNIMPCVLPVIALKILGFVNQAKEAPRRVRLLGLIYVLGVLASFLVLALLVIAAKAAGSAVGWGFQFSNPYFLVVMTILVTLIALNLFGVFEITLSGQAMSAAATLSSRHGAAGAFFNGLLATVLATSCSAPYLAGAVGFAFAASASLIVLVMLTVGLGLAAPYLVLSWYPRLLRYLPRPGPWMEKFKIAMGFPMLAAAVWLCSLLETHYGERVWWMAVFLVFVAVAAWVYGEFVQRGTKRRLLAGALAAAVLVAGYLYAVEHGLRWRVPAAETASAALPEHAPAGLPWEKWSPQAVAEAQRAGHPVLVDFTAKWCLTCNLYVKPVLESDAVQQKLKQTGARLLLADYTRYGADVAAGLRSFERSGVPLVVVYPRNQSLPPVVFDGVTPSGLVDALNRAAQ